MKLLPFVVMLLVAGCATSKGNERAAQHGADQIRMIAVQKEAQLKEEQAQAAANEKLYEALARVAESNPDHAPSVAVALAVIGVSGGQSGEGDNGRVVTLQQQQNTALEWTKALAPTVGNLVSGLGIAAINAETQRNQSDNNRDIMLGDQQQNARIVEAVANLGSTAVENTGMSVGGSYYDLEGEAYVDNSTTSSADTNTTTSTTTSTTATTEISADTTLSYQGESMTLADLISQLQSAGATYSIDLDGDGVADVSTSDGEGAEVEINCNLTFGPVPPQCL